MVISYIDHWHCIYIHLSTVVHVSQEQRENFHQQFLLVQECLFAHCKNVQKCLQWVQWSQRCRLSISAVRSGPRQTCKPGLTMFGIESTILKNLKLWFLTLSNIQLAQYFLRILLRVLNSSVTFQMWVANFNFNYLSHFCINFENSCAHHQEEILTIPKHPQKSSFWWWLAEKTAKNEVAPKIEYQNNFSKTLSSLEHHNLASDSSNWASRGCFGIVKSSSWRWAQRFFKLMHPRLSNTLKTILKKYCTNCMRPDRANIFLLLLWINNQVRKNIW